MHNVQDPESELARIALTEGWDLPQGIKDYAMLLEETFDQVKQVRNRMEALASDGKFNGAMKDAAVDRCNLLLQKIQEHQDSFTTAVGKLRSDLDRANETIAYAKNVILPGDTVNDVLARMIGDSRTSEVWNIGPLGEVSLMAGGAGVLQANSMLSALRKQKAKEEYDQIQRMMPIGRDFDLNNIDIEIKDPPYIDDPDDRSGSSGSGWSSGGSSAGVLPGLGGGAAAALAAGVVMAGKKAGGSGAGSSSAARSVSGVKSSGSVSAVSSSASSSSVLGQRTPPAGFASWEEYRNSIALPARPTQGGSSSSTSLNHNSSLSSSNAHDGYWFDPVRNEWVRVDVDDDRVSVDSPYVTGSDGFAHGALGAGTAAAGVGAAAALKFASSHASGAAGSGIALSGTGVGAGGASVGMSGVGASGVGSYYANTPVSGYKVGSSIQGARGLAAGLPTGAAGEAAAGSASGSRASTPGMMGGAQGAGSQEKKKGKRRGLGYVVPVIEEEEEFQPKPRAAMAGRRKETKQ